MRRLIAAFKMSLDGKIEGPSGAAEWVQAWSDDYGLSEEIDACVLGGEMYKGYEPYWTAIQANPKTPIWTDKPPTRAECKWAQLATTLPHYVVSSSQKSAQWSNTKFLRRIEDVAALKRARGKDIYLMGGARLTVSLMGAGLVDELRLIVHPLIAGAGKELLGTNEERHLLALRKSSRLPNGCVKLIYDITNGEGKK